MDKLKETYFHYFKAQYNMMKSLQSSLSKEETFQKTGDAVSTLLREPIDEKQIENWKLELYQELVGFVYQTTPVVLRLKDPSGWYDTSSKASQFFWQRYSQYLSRSKNWPQQVIDVIDETTDDIMASLGDPKSTDQFDSRGLVLGYVQSGKTANFTGLINKAFDEGYKLIIVLSGIHNDLRAQTQMRLQEEVVGYADNKVAGVGKIVPSSSDHFVQALTTIDRDVTGLPENLIYNLMGSKTLMIVKKNKDVLERLKSLLGNLIKQANGKSVPVLIIDDEADQASIDTSDRTKGEDPKTINRLIREVISLFHQKGYVGYTATPFANLLIGTEGETEEAGQDLYPKDFLVGLPKPADYCGPDEFFNTVEDADDNRPSLIVEISEVDEKLFSSIKKQDQHSEVEAVPPKMKEALYAFLISTSIRNLRGHLNAHNSMLIHTSRFTKVQTTLKEVIEEEFNDIVNAVRYEPENDHVKAIYNLYQSEFAAKTQQWNDATGSHYDSFDWRTVYDEMKITAKTINVMEINGESEDALEYHRYKEQGLNVIAVGGDKLSRGLTLEGLTISYYYRNTLMYDTLMQMGRWFGYRKGYMDLCRIYTSGEIASNFEHLAVAMHELRAEFDRLKNESLSPSDYAVRMLAHPKMMLTSNLKMKNAHVSYQNYSGNLHQTRLFSNEKKAFEDNMKAAVELISDVYPNIFETEKKEKKGKTKYHVADEVSVEKILKFLSDYHTYQSSIKSSSESMIEYIKTLNEDHQKLLSWKVVVVEGIPNESINAQPVKLGSLTLDYAVVRGQSEKNSLGPKEKVDVKAIVAAGQALFDEEKGAKKVTAPKLFIYPLNPNTPVFAHVQSVGFSESLVPIGFAVAFPNENEEVSKQVYMKNKSVKEKRQV